MATVRQLLDVAVARLREAGSETARLDAELLLAHALDTDRTGVIAHTDAPVGDGAAARFEAASTGAPPASPWPTSAGSRSSTGSRSASIRGR